MNRRAFLLGGAAAAAELAVPRKAYSFIWTPNASLHARMIRDPWGDGSDGVILADDERLRMILAKKPELLRGTFGPSMIALTLGGYMMFTGPVKP